MIQRSVQTLAVVVTLCSLGALACDRSSGGDSVEQPPATVTPGVEAAAPAPLASASASASATATRLAPDAAAAMPIPERRHVGLAGILLKSAYDLTLTDAQRAALDKADGQLYPDTAPTPWMAVKTFQSDLVAGIRAGKIDPAAVKADEVAFDKAVAAGQAAEADALNTLHGALDAPTRQSLADRIKAKRAAHDHEPLPGAGAVDGGAADWVRRRLERMTRQLALDDAQQKQVAALLAKDTAMMPAATQARRDATQKRVDTLLADFPKDTFDAKKAELTAPPGKTPHDRLDQAATFAMGLLPILKPDQVTKFADQTERMGNRPERYFEDIDHGPPPAGPVDESGWR